MAALIPVGIRNAIRSETGPMFLGVELKDAREELFVVMVCDGLSLGVAFARAGFSSTDHSAASKLFALPRIQARAEAVLEARRTTGVLSLPEVTDMLKRVYAGAQSEGEYSAAHNAAFSLARLYGHVTDRSIVETIRRPSRDPDAPSEQALASWVETLPGLDGPVSAAIEGPGPGPAVEGPSIGPPRSAPAELLGPEVPGPQSELVSNINGLAEGPGPGRSRTGNGAPVGPVTGTPDARGQSGLLVSRETGTGTKMGEIPSFEELFG